MVLAVQLINKIKKKKKTKNLKNYVSLYFPHVSHAKIHIFLVNLLFFVCFRR